VASHPWLEEHAVIGQTPDLVSQLDSAISRDQGLALLLSSFSEVSDELAETLSARGAALKDAGEAVLSEDFAAWASETRSLVTRRLAMSVKGEDAAVAFLRTQSNRFDDAFYDLCFRITAETLRRVTGLLEPLGAGEPSAAAISEQLNSAKYDVECLDAVGEVTGNLLYRAKTSLLTGTFLLHRSQLEALQGRTVDAAETAVKSAKALESAAANTLLSAEQRALAEMRLAALAGASKPDELAKHQEAGLAIAEAGEAWDAVLVIRRDRAYWAQQRGDWNAVWTLYQQNIELSERLMQKARVNGDAMQVEQQAQPDYEGAVEACLHLAESDPSFYERALECAEQGKARAFLRGLASIAMALGPIPPKLAERRNRILQQMQESNGDAELLSALRTIEDQIWAHPRAWALDTTCVPCSFDQKRALVPRDGVILSYFAFPDRLLIFALGEQGLLGKPAQIEVSSGDLAKLAAELQATMRLRGDYETIDAMQRKLAMRVEPVNSAMYLRQFHDIALKPVQSLIAGKRIVVVVPHRVMMGLPFHAFTDAGGRTLIDDAAVAYSPGVSILRWSAAQQRSDLNTCFAAGVSRMAGGPKNAEREATQVAQVFGTGPSPATRDAVFANAGKCDVIHLSCHSDMGPLFTAFAGLRLEDGPLYQREIPALNCLSTLVMLSACTTAGGDTMAEPGSELAGLVGAFFRAGCPSVIASLWPVADDAALPLSEAFYAALKTDGAGKAEALRQAQLAVRRRTDDGFDDPYFWAPFCLWGNY